MVQVSVESYKGYDIEYDEYNNAWCIKNLDVIRDSLRDIKEKIDEIEKKKFVPIKAFKSDYDEGFVEVEITSFVEKDHAWIRVPDKSCEKRQTSREKRQLKRLYLRNEYNFKLIEEIKKKTEEILKIKEEKEKLFSALEFFKTP